MVIYQQLNINRERLKVKAMVKYQQRKGDHTEKKKIRIRATSPRGKKEKMTNKQTADVDHIRAH